ncbi:hypothetical protein HN51_053014, partial [Arachis hypogaea]
MHLRTQDLTCLPNSSEQEFYCQITSSKHHSLSLSLLSDNYFSGSLPLSYLKNFQEMMN